MNGQEIVPHEPRRPVGWTFVDVAWALLTVMLLQGGCAWILLPRRAPAADNAAVAETADEHPAAEHPSADGGDDHAAENATPEATPVDVRRIFAGIAGGSLGNILAVSLAIMWLILHCADKYDLGLDLSHAVRDVRLGAAGFAMAMVPVMVLQGVLSQFIEPSHPVTDDSGPIPGPASWL